MINEIISAIYRMLRKKAGLTQAELAPILKISRSKMVKVESGRSRLNEEQEQQLIDFAQCSREEFAEMACQRLSKMIDKRVGIQDDHCGYEPKTALAGAYAVLRNHPGALPLTMTRTLNNKIKTTRMMGIAFEGNNADLMEYTQDCLEKIHHGKESPPGEAAL